MYCITAEKNRFVIGSLIIAMIILMLSSMSSSSLIARETMRTPSATDPTTTVAPSTISQEGDFTAQAPLQIPRTLQSNDLVNSLAFYEVTFITSTTGAIDKIRMDFAAGTNINAAGVIEKIGIGGGTLLKATSSLTYDVTSPVSIPAGTFIRLEIFGIKNPFNPSTSNTATITTRDNAGNLIDGPSVTNVYIIKQIEGNDVAESFMKRVTVIDDPNGHAVGWDPTGVENTFRIDEPAIGPDIDNPFFIIEVRIPGEEFNLVDCEVTGHNAEFKEFYILCAEEVDNPPPVDGSELHYVVGNLPEHVICGPGFCRQ